LIDDQKAVKSKTVELTEDDLAKKREKAKERRRRTHQGSNLLGSIDEGTPNKGRKSRISEPIKKSTEDGGASSLTLGDMVEVFRGHNKLKNGLKAISDYRVVSPEVWALYKTLYGGGPILCQLGPDMYGPSVLKKKEEIKKLREEQNRAEKQKGKKGYVPIFEEKHGQTADRRHHRRPTQVAQRKQRASLLDTLFNKEKEDPLHMLKVMRERDREQRQMEIEEQDGYTNADKKGVFRGPLLQFGKMNPVTIPERFDKSYVPPPEEPKPEEKKHKHRVSFKEENMNSDSNGGDTQEKYDPTPFKLEPGSPRKTSDVTGTTADVEISDTTSIVSDTPSAMPSEMSMGLDAEHVDHRLFGGYDVEWVADDHVKSCMVNGCGRVFTFMRRKHHCRKCGRVVCSRCSRSRQRVEGLQWKQRVCDECIAFQNKECSLNKRFQKGETKSSGFTIAGVTFTESSSPTKAAEDKSSEATDTKLSGWMLYRPENDTGLLQKRFLVSNSTRNTLKVFKTALDGYYDRKPLAEFSGPFFVGLWDGKTQFKQYDNGLKVSATVNFAGSSDALFFSAADLEERELWTQSLLQI